jgi:phosphocarrier protein
VSRLTRTLQITNKRGLHARASAKFVTLAAGQDAQVTVAKDGNEVIGTSIMGLMMLGAAKGDEIVISTEGTNAQGALDLLSALVEDRFGEE